MLNSVHSTTLSVGGCTTVRDAAWPTRPSSQFPTVTFPAAEHALLMLVGQLRIGATVKKKHPYIHGHFVASFRYFNGTSSYMFVFVNRRNN